MNISADSLGGNITKNASELWFGSGSKALVILMDQVNYIAMPLPSCREWKLLPNTKEAIARYNNGDDVDVLAITSKELQERRPQIVGTTEIK